MSVWPDDPLAPPKIEIADLDQEEYAVYVYGALTVIPGPEIRVVLDV